MSKREHPVSLTIARAVTRKHADIFAREAYEVCIAPFSMHEAFDATGLVAWPPGTLDDHEAQTRYHDIEDEIFERTFEAVKPAVAEAFLRIAREVLAREQAAQAKGKRR